MKKVLALLALLFALVYVSKQDKSKQRGQKKEILPPSSLQSKKRFKIQIR
jgi:hypothetical protein